MQDTLKEQKEEDGKIEIRPGDRFSQDLPDVGPVHRLPPAAVHVFPLSSASEQTKEKEEEEHETLWPTPENPLHRL